MWFTSINQWNANLNVWKCLGVVSSTIIYIKEDFPIQSLAFVTLIPFSNVAVSFPHKIEVENDELIEHDMWFVVDCIWPKKSDDIITNSELDRFTRAWLFDEKSGLVNGGEGVNIMGTHISGFTTLFFEVY